ncbi:MAG: hypothetical protein AAF708_19530 [Deinococcota bacterium]
MSFGIASLFGLLFEGAKLEEAIYFLPVHIAHRDEPMWFVLESKAPRNLTSIEGFCLSYEPDDEALVPFTLTAQRIMYVIDEEAYLILLSPVELTDPTLEPRLTRLLLNMDWERAKKILPFEQLT